MPQVSYWRIVFLLLIAGSVYFLGLGAARLWDRDEPRNARASHEMLERGDWIVPTFNGSLRDHKPILLYWGQMLSYLTLGESEFTARLPSALCALLTIGAVAVLGSRLSGRSHGISSEGYWGAACLATCGLFVMAGRAATPDACLIAFSTLGIAALVTSTLVPSAPFSSGRVGSGKWIQAMFGYTMLGLAGLAKGPVGIVLPLVVVHVWWLVCRRLQMPERTSGNSSGSWAERLTTAVVEVWRTFNPLQCWRSVLALRTIPGILLSLLAAAPWYIAVGLATNGDFLRGFFLEHNVGRALGSMEGHQGSLLFYPLAFLVGTFPWSMWLLPVLLWCRSAWHENVVQRQLIVLSGVWIAVYVGAFSLASTKLPSYITPCYAGAALALGGYWKQFEHGWTRPSWPLRRIAYTLTVIVGAAIGGGLYWLSRSETMPLLAWAAVGGAVIAALGIVGFACELRNQLHRLPMAWLGGAAAFQIVLFGLGTKSVDGYRHDLAALSEIAQPPVGASAASDRPAKRWLAIGGMEPSWVHYLNSEIFEVTQSPSDPQAWEQVSQFVDQNPEGRLIVVGPEAYAAFGQWQARAAAQRYVEVAQAPRFLQPGTLHIFEAAESATGQVRSTRLQQTAQSPLPR